MDAVDLPPTPLIEAQALSHTYGDGTPALKALSFRITAGECVAVIGANGAGKSTLLMHLNGHLRATGGSLHIAGQALAPETLKAVRRRVGLVFQDPDDQLFMPTVFDDVAFGPRHHGLPESGVAQRVQQALQQVGLWALQARTPQRLSGGEKKRIAIAGVLAMAPEVLVLDEPTSGLDPLARRQLMALLAGLPQTRIVTSHDLDMVLALCPRSIVLADGVLMADGPTRAIFADAGLLARCRLEPPLALQACPLCGTGPRR